MGGNGLEIGVQEKKEQCKLLTGKFACAFSNE